jgi:DNA polymerase I-like protein with 3'-5' exonuclease and polymerase domains
VSIRLTSPVQATGADIMKLALVLIVQAIDTHPELAGWEPVLTAHDSVALEGPEATKELMAKVQQQAMTNAFNRLLPDVPLRPDALEIKSCVNYGGDTVADLDDVEEED